MLRFLQVTVKRGPAMHKKRQMNAADLIELRAQVQQLFQANAHESSTFLASKLVYFSKAASCDVFLLAQIHVANHKPLSALQLLDQYKLCTLRQDKQYVAYCLLAAQANLAAGRTEEVIQVSESVLLPSKPTLSSSSTREQQDSLLMDVVGGGVDFVSDLLESLGAENSTLLSLLCLERAKAYELLDNRTKCLHWYKQSLLFDCKVVESLERMVSLRLSYREEQSLLQELERAHCFTHTPWLKSVYVGVLTMHQTTILTSKAEEGTMMERDPDLLAVRAEAKYTQRDAKGALKLTTYVFKELSVPPTNSRCALVHIASLVELGKASELFYFAHKQVAEQPKQALSWYAVGAYYYSAKKFDLSRRFFAKASQLDAGMLEAFIGSAHAHAMNEESDRAISIYRAAARLFPSSHIPLLGTSMEYLRTNNPALAQQFCEVAKNLCEVDPAVYNELGVIAYRMGDFLEACKWFHEALTRIQALQQHFTSITLETVTFNFAHALRRAGQLAEALQQFKAALRLCPKSASGHAALGLTHHMDNDAERAIECYHVALGLRPNDTLVAELMEFALVDLYTLHNII